MLLRSVAAPSPLRGGVMITRVSGSGGGAAPRQHHHPAALAMVTAATATVVWSSSWNPRKHTECSGIIGVVGKQCDARAILVDGLSALKLRNKYDSASMATMRYDGQGPMTIIKYGRRRHEDDDDEEDDPVERVIATPSKPQETRHSVGLAHVRWGTHGRPTDDNAHPHTTSSGRHGSDIALVHNGSLHNVSALRAWLRGRGHLFVGETDTEVLVTLIGPERVTHRCSLKEAVEHALQRCEGTWGLVVMSVDEPEKIVVARHGSPLWVGFFNNDTSGGDEGVAMVSSDHKALSQYTNSILPLEEGAVAEVYVMGVHGGHDNVENIRPEHVFTPLPVSSSNKSPNVERTNQSTLP